MALWAISALVAFLTLEGPAYAALFWALSGGGAGAVVQCVELDAGNSTSLAVVGIEKCIDGLIVEYAWTDGNICGSFTPAGNLIRKEAREKCIGRQKIEGISCRSQRSESLPAKSLEEAFSSLQERILLADSGGGTSGGGDFDGADAARTLQALIKAISLADQLYSPEKKARLIEIAKKLKIVVLDIPLAVNVGGAIQSGAAYSEWHGSTPTAFLIRDRWKTNENAIGREALLHHELAVLAGLEATGDYHLTSRYEDFRINNWKFREMNEAQDCTIAVFERANSRTGRSSPGKSVGAASMTIESFGVRSGLARVGNVSKKRDMKVTYVISSSGYLRLKLIETDRDKDGAPFIGMNNATTLVEESMIFDPYGDSLYAGVGAKQIVTDKYFITVSCTR